MNVKLVKGYIIIFKLNWSFQQKSFPFFQRLSFSWPKFHSLVFIKNCCLIFRGVAAQWSKTLPDREIKRGRSGSLAATELEEVGRRWKELEKRLLISFLPQWTIRDSVKSADKCLVKCRETWQGLDGGCLIGWVLPWKTQYSIMDQEISRHTNIPLGQLSHNCLQRKHAKGQGRSLKELQSRGI